MSICPWTLKIYQVEGTVLISVRIFVNKMNTYRLRRWNLRTTWKAVNCFLDIAHVKYSNRRAHKLKLSCPLVLKNLTVDKFGRYTCQAGNGYRNHCTRKSFEIVIQGKQTRLVISLINNYSTSACWICDDRRPTRPIGPSWPSMIAYPKSASGTIIKSKKGPEHI